MGRFIQGLVETQHAGILLILFFVLFVVILFWVYRPKGKQTYDEIAQIPLHDEPKR